MHVTGKSLNASLVKMAGCTSEHTPNRALLIRMPEGTLDSYKSYPREAELTSQTRHPRTHLGAISSTHGSPGKEMGTKMQNKAASLLNLDASQRARGT